MGLTNLESVDHFTAVNRRNYEEYREGLAGLPSLSLMEYDDRERCNYQYIVVEVDEASIPITRDELVAVLQAEQVLARRYFYPGCHRMEPYRSFFPHAGLLLAETESLARRVLLLPTGTSVGPHDVATICAVLRLAVDNAEAVVHALSARSATTSAGAR